ncbi:methyltransferase domain-containing protein [Stieleria sp. JC731]|uniref:class I SAM-dependent methyltransferase n=1 Tax=Pirellulaceae TaxID=2691357 RepID=UPI001E4F21C9|nr:class I SAM-dependent methyltransferase [Stieleria sp. JC731]MCC9602171.1 methyltransferase domain-containing protein [Stieleria sp. JC731]
MIEPIAHAPKLFRQSQLDSRHQYLDAYDDIEAERFDQWTLALDEDDHQACLDDIASAFSFQPGMRVLDVGAGTGALSLSLRHIDGLELSALEPSLPMSDRYRAKDSLADVHLVNGFCDHTCDRKLFDEGQFDVIASRLLVNCLYDPLAAFSNWRHWLRPGGCLIVIDGLFDRDGWNGKWSDFVDSHPLSINQSMSLVPYLIEKSGFHLQHVGWMEQTNARPSTKTKRYIVVAEK